MMNFRAINCFILILLVLINSIISFSILNSNNSKSVDGKENTIKEAGDQIKYNYNLTNAESFATEKVNFIDLEQMKRSCCTLAKIAAKSGFFCNLKFYSYKLLYRIRNRTHRKHIQIIGNNREQLITKQLMFKFSKCLNGFTEVFESCCWDQVERESEY